MEKIARYPWSEFPPVWVHAPESQVKFHPQYAAAKQGDPDAALHLVRECVSSETVSVIKHTFHPFQPTIVAAHAIEREGVNAIPQALADLLGTQLGWPVDSGVVQSNIVAHTGADGFSRLSRQARFEGAVIANIQYFLADDFVGQGGTLANLRSFLISCGGIVVGSSTLTGKSFSATLSLENETVIKLRQKHGPGLENWWNKEYGFGYECLTESEARYLLRSPNADRIRDRITEAFESRNF